MTGGHLLMKYSRISAAALALASAAVMTAAVPAYAAEPAETLPASGIVLGAQKTSLSGCKVTMASGTNVFNGGETRPKLTVKLNGKTLREGTDYTVTYANCKAVGKGSATIRGKGSYSGGKRVTFSIKPAQVTGFTYSAAANSVTLKWNTVKGCGGYKIYRYNASKGKYTLIKTVASQSSKSFTNKSLKAGTTYKYKIRAYKAVSGSYIYGATAALTAKTKTASSSAGSTPVAANGKLRVSGANIVNSSGKKFQIRGMSTHGIMWEDFSDILSKNSLKVLRDDWGVNTIRIAMYTQEYGGYTTGSDFASQAKKKVVNGVQNATDLGMYAVIDWHILSDGNPQTYQPQAVSFFTEMAKKYKDYDNVLYEICNEPNGGASWSGNIKPYAQAVIKAIRKYDDDAIIIVGTPTWSQDIHEAANDRLSDKNTVYALHFYANTHTDWLRDRLKQCYNSGLPVLVSEFGTCDASGNGGFNSAETNKWFDLLDSKMIGYINWSACGKNETASAFVQGTNLASIKSGTSQLTESGRLVRSHYVSRKGK